MLIAESWFESGSPIGDAIGFFVFLIFLVGFIAGSHQQEKHRGSN